DAPVGTIKFYLREGLLPPGWRTSRTAAEYDDAQVERIRLIRALTDAGGLGIAALRRIVTVLDSPQPARLDLLATALDSLPAPAPAPPRSRRGRPALRCACGSRGGTSAPPCARPGRGPRLGDLPRGSPARAARPRLAGLWGGRDRRRRRPVGPVR